MPLLFGRRKTKSSTAAPTTTTAVLPVSFHDDDDDDDDEAWMLRRWEEVLEDTVRATCDTLQQTTLNVEESVAQWWTDQQQLHYVAGRVELFVRPILLPVVSLVNRSFGNSSSNTPNERHHHHVAVAVLLLVLLLLLAFGWRRRRRRRQRRQQEAAARRRVPTIDFAVARARTRTDSSASVLAAAAAARMSTSTGGTAGILPFSRKRSLSLDQQRQPLLQRLTGGTGGFQARNSSNSRALSPSDAAAIPTSADNFRDSDVLAEDLQWLAEEFLDRMLLLEYEDQQQQQRGESFTLLTPRARARTGSSSIGHKSSRQRRLLLQEQAQASSSLRLLGPAKNTLSFRTLTPPPSWAEASRNLVVPDVGWKLSRDVSLHLFSSSTTTSQAGSSPHPVGTATLVIQKVSSNSNSIHHTSSKGAGASTDLAYRNKQQQQQLKQLERDAFRRPVTDCSIHVKRPAEGGVLELYETNLHDNSNNHPWMEHTFHTAAEAAQFQLDFLALQVLGPALHNMYQALALLHQGSDAFVGYEPVLHYQHEDRPSRNSGNHNNEETSTPDEGAEERKDSERGRRKSDFRPVFAQDSGIAWDDVMRCLGSSFPSIRLRLEAIWWLEVQGSLLAASSAGRLSLGRKKKGRTAAVKNTSPGAGVATDETPAAMSYLAPEYAGKRLLLGPVDFFRLFVPSLPETAVPEEESHRGRMEQMLRWRKRVARASVLVQAYTRAKTVVNRGWNLAPNAKLPDNYLKRRLAFDDDTDNRRRDAYIKNEYYEATVSRDIIAEVRGSEQLENLSWWNRGLEGTHASAMSLYQGYSLVGIHAFQWPGRSADNFDALPLHPKKDPVHCIPSLRQLIADNPDLDFFVHAYFPEAQKAVVVNCFVRSLPEGVDKNFDTVIRRFVEGDEEFRRRKLEVILQLVVRRDSISLFGRFLLWWLSFLLRLSHHNVRQTASSSETTSIPALRLAECGETHHFGGSLQTDPAMPQNYVASTIHMESQRVMTYATRLMLCYVEFGGLSRNISDFTYVIAGEEQDELPERAMCTSRMVRCTLNSIALDSDVDGIELQAIEPPKFAEGTPNGLYLKIFVTDPLVVAAKSLIRSVQGLRTFSENFNPVSPVNALLRRTPRNGGSLRAIVDASAADPFEKAVNELVHILEDVKIPVRKLTDSNGYDYSPTNATSAASIVSGISTVAMQIGDFVEQPILFTVSRSDIRRYFIASDCSLRTASVRLIESATWRALTFPIDTRTCRIELQSGQFFQQGEDLDGNPVFYFRNTCLGPWRKDEDAVISAVLHRLETRLEELIQENPLVQCTLIVMMGRPYRRKKKKASKESDASPTKQPRQDKGSDLSLDQETAASTAFSAVSSLGGEESSDEEERDHEDDSEESPHRVQSNNPRIFRDEVWNPHTSRPLIERLIQILLAHYPERLSKALVVIGHKNKRYVRSTVGGVLALTSAVSSSKTREKVKFLTHYSELQKYVDRSELITLVGGTQRENLQHYECK